MSCDRIQKMLDDHVDGALDSAATRATEAHLDRCPRCRGIEQELRSLLEAAEDLPRGIAPERDLLPGIRGAVGMTKRTMPSALPSKATPSWSRWIGLAASLFLLSAAVITFLRLGGPDEPIPVAATSGGAVAANFESADPYRAAEDDYLEATRQSLEQCIGTEYGEPRCGELDGEWNAVESAHDGGDGGEVLVGELEVSGAIGEQRDRIGLEQGLNGILSGLGNGQRFQLEHAFSRYPEAFARRHHEGGVGRRR